MKRLLCLMIGILACGALVASADTYTYSKVITNGQTIAYSDQLPVSGWLDKIEIAPNSSTMTSTVTVATYLGTTAVDTYASYSALTGNLIVRPRVVGTTSAGVALTAAVSTGTYSNTTTQLSVPYERILIGSNVKIATTGGGVAGETGAFTNTVRVFYVPLSAK